MALQNKIKLDEEESKHVNPTQQNDFGPTLLNKMLRLVKGTTKLTHVDWINSLIGPSGLPLIASTYLQS